jgi:Asp-tRNA(Asn)/Glu-tRNA(Gln) amidotransferase A subunit family amidase
MNVSLTCAVKPAMPDSLDKPCVFEGAPISLQVAAARWEDEKVMRALSLIAGIVQA